MSTASDRLQCTHDYLNRQYFTSVDISNIKQYTFVFMVLSALLCLIRGLLYERMVFGKLKTEVRAVEILRSLAFLCKSKGAPSHHHLL